MTPLFKKLNFKAQPHIVILQAPQSFEPELQQMQAFTQVHTNLDAIEAVTFAMIFVTRLKEIEKWAPAIAEKLEGDGIVWFCYPKGSSKKYKCDFNRDTGWDLLGSLCFEGVRMVAIDADWSALRFRKATYIKNMTRSFARSEEGKQKTATKKAR